MVGILLLVAEEAEAKAKENAEAKLFDEEISKGGMCNSATAEFLKRRKMQEDFAEFAKAAGGR